MLRQLFLSIFSLSLVLSRPLHSIEAGIDKVIEANSQFAFDLYRQFRNQKGNFFFSPYNISATFAMAVTGAQGETANEMQKVLHYPTNLFPLIGDLNHYLTAGKQDRNSPQLLIANAIWIQKDFSLLPVFQRNLNQFFGVSAGTVDFIKEPVKAVKVINQWVSEQTRGKINQLLLHQDVSESTRLVLTSAIYMKGQWMYPFDPKETALGPFSILNRHTLQAFMMKKTATYSLLINQHFAMLEIPYVNTSEGPALSLVVLLPNENVGLDTLENELNIENWHHWTSQLKPRRVSLVFPKFRMEDRTDLNQMMKELGMIQAFSPKADFSGMTGQKDLFINKAIHKTFIRVDEYGTEAAATTAVEMTTTAILAPEEPYSFVADHPFIYLIVDNRTKSILFMGRLVQPQ